MTNQILFRKILQPAMFFEKNFDKLFSKVFGFATDSDFYDSNEVFFKIGIIN